MNPLLAYCFLHTDSYEEDGIENDIEDDTESGCLGVLIALSILITVVAMVRKHFTR